MQIFLVIVSGVCKCCMHVFQLAIWLIPFASNEFSKSNYNFKSELWGQQAKTLSTLIISSSMHRDYWNHNLTGSIFSRGV